MSKKSDSKDHKSSRELPGNHNELIEQARKELGNIFNFWQLNAPDNSYGGFFGRRDHFNRVIPKAEKGIILNARILWAFSAAGNFYGKPQYLEICKRAFSYLRDKFNDERYGGVIWMVHYDGTPADTRKQVYAQAFTIYSLSEYYKYSGDKNALQWAMDIFAQLEEKALDHVSGGYIECFTQDWKAIGDMRLSEKDLNASKTMNTHLHILEAYTSLLEVSDNQRVSGALEDLIHLFLNKFLTEDYTFKLFFNDDWVNLDTEISFGHNIEAGWLLINAARQLGNKQFIKTTESIAVSIADSVMKQGQDIDYGIYNKMDKLTGEVDTDKHWWPQCEAVVGLLYVWKITKEFKYLDMARKVWTFIEQNILDKTNGEWFFRVNKEGVPYENENKVGPWKCPYHNSRACIEIIILLENGSIPSVPL